MEPTTPETMISHGLAMYFDADEEMSGGSPISKREAVVQKAIDFAISRGCLPEDAEKLRAALIGLPNSRGEVVPGPMALVTWRICMCDVNALVDARNEIWQPMAGKLPVTSRNGQPYEIPLRPYSDEDPQITFGVAIQKRGSAVVDENTGEVHEQPFFWTYSGVTLQTVTRKTLKGDILPGYPMSLAFDVDAAVDTNGKGRKSLTGRWSRRLYINRTTNPLTNMVETTNRLAGLVRGPNDELKFLGALIDAGFPVHTARVNRNPVGQNSQWQPRNQRQAQPARTLVGATAGAPNGIVAPDEDPFA